MGLKESLEHQQKVLELQLAVARERFQHHGLRGGAVEASLRGFIETNLPRTFMVGTGEAIATKGDDAHRTSRQLDVIISNEMQPFSVARDEATVLLIEGINAAGEVKSVLNRSDFCTEIEKSRTFKSLRANNLSGLASVPKADCWEAYYVHYRPYFLFSFETAVNWKWYLLDTFDYILENKKIPYDALFIMDKGIVILISPFLKSPFSKFAGIPFFYDNPDCKNSIGGIHIYNTSAFLAFFLTWLSMFRGSILSDRSALPYYLEEVINDSIEDIVLSSANESDAGEFIEAAKAGIESNPLKFIADHLRRDLKGK